jgi:hypothetical protein
LEVVISVATSLYPFYFVFVPRIASNREEIRFGEGALPKQILCCLPKNSYLPARTSDCLAIFCALAPHYYATFISFALFHLSNRRSSKKSFFLYCSVLTDFCQLLHLPLNPTLLLFLYEERALKEVVTVANVLMVVRLVLKLDQIRFIIIDYTNVANEDCVKFCMKEVFKYREGMM